MHLVFNLAQGTSSSTPFSHSSLGMELQKGVYNTIMWIMVIVLLVGSVFLFLLFKRSFAVTNQTKSELDTIMGDYEEYRRSSREKYEKLVVSHHSEIMKLKNS